MKRYRLGMTAFLLAEALCALSIATDAPAAKELSITVSESSPGRVAFGSDVVVGSGESVEDLVVIGGNATVEGTVRKDAVVLGGNLLVRSGGNIGKDAVVVGGSLYCEEGGNIAHDRVVMGGGAILKKLALGGLLAGLIGSSAGFLFGLHFAASLAKLAVLLVLGILCLTFLAQPTRRLADCLAARPGRSLAAGLLLLLLFVPLLLLLLISLLGIPLIPLLALAYLAAIVFGTIAAAFLLGSRVAERFFHSRSAFLGLLLGLALLSALTWIPFFGWLLCLALICGTLGAAWLTRFGSREATPHFTPPSTAAAANDIGSKDEEVRR